MVDGVTSNDFYHRCGTLKRCGQFNVPGIQFEGAVEIAVSGSNVCAHALFGKQIHYVYAIPSYTCHWLTHSPMIDYPVKTPERSPALAESPGLRFVTISILVYE